VRGKVTVEERRERERERERKTDRQIECLGRQNAERE
jgi:hypothetical protein